MLTLKNLLTNTINEYKLTDSTIQVNNQNDGYLNIILSFSDNDSMICLTEINTEGRESVQAFQYQNLSFDERKCMGFVCKIQSEFFQILETVIKCTEFSKENSSINCKILMKLFFDDENYHISFFGRVNSNSTSAFKNDFSEQSIIVRLRRVVFEDVYISVALNDKIKSESSDGSKQVDYEKLTNEAIIISKNDYIYWGVESSSIELHPIQQELPDDRYVEY